MTNKTAWQRSRPGRPDRNLALRVRLARPAVPIPVEAVHIIPAAATGPVECLRFELRGEVAAVVGVDAALAAPKARPDDAAVRTTVVVLTKLRQPWDCSA